MSTGNRSRAADAPDLRPLPFAFDRNSPTYLPSLKDEEYGDIVATLKALAKGKFPRQDSVPTALNAYNCTQPNKPWVYFHPIKPLEVVRRRGGRPTDAPVLKEAPDVRLPAALRADLNKPWVSIRLYQDYKAPLQERKLPRTPHPCSTSTSTNSRIGTTRSNTNTDTANTYTACGERHQPGNPNRNAARHQRSGSPGSGSGSRSRPAGWTHREGRARYRYVCYIHEHKVSLRPGSRRSVYTISVWDREWNELTWHDAYPVGRAARRAEARLFWDRAAAQPGFPLFPRAVVAVSGMALGGSGGGGGAGGVGGRDDNPRRTFVDRIRVRDRHYRAAERLGAAMRDHPPPRFTLWSVMGIAMHHMNHAHDAPHASIVPDYLEYFGGHQRELLPRLFAHLLSLCLQLRAPGLVMREPGREQRRGGLFETAGAENVGVGVGAGQEEEEEEGEVEEEEGEEVEAEEVAEEQLEDLASFAKQFWIDDRLPWMRQRTRWHLEARLPPSIQGRVFEALRIN
ncbi:hypothetical protein SLS62_010175 [Diatrype stigma]|uniref:Uncharacterized protein n=1 Tax=Diatrype stigma TaxID=117547 RepID=A0AAN9UAL7_9PEZI